MQQGCVRIPGDTLYRCFNGRGQIFVTTNPACDFAAAPVKLADGNFLNGWKSAVLFYRNYEDVTRIVSRKSVRLRRTAIPSLGRNLRRAVPITEGKVV